MAIVERIQTEHRDIRERLTAFDKGLVDLALGRNGGGHDLAAGLDTFIQSSVLPHFVLEEKAVFPQLATGSTEEKDLARELLADHVALRDSFVNYIVEARKGQVTEEFLALARGMSARLSTHDQREDLQLVPLLRRWMGLGGVPLAAQGKLVNTANGPQVASALSDVAQLLARSRLFSRLSGPELDAVAAVGRWREYAAGEVIARESDDASTVSVIERGTVAVVRTVPTKAGTMSFTSALATAGDVIGWSALVEPHHYSATGQCMVPVRCLEMDGEALHSLLAGSPTMYSKVLESLVMMVRGRLNDTMEALARNL